MQGKTSYLYAWDFNNNLAHFIELDREDLYNSSFLDQRISAKDNSLTTASIDTVMTQSIHDATHTTPVFIFHTAFCCSTLLARSLDIPGKTLVFREPLTLLQMADLKRGLSKTSRDYQPLLAMTLKKLTNSFIHEKQIIIKPTNLANNLIADLINIYPTTRILLLYDDFESFLASVLKRPQESATGIDLFLKRLLADTSRSPQKISNSETGEKLHLKAALAWALQKLELNDAVTKYADWIRIIYTPDFLASPEPVLLETARWFNLNLAPGAFHNIANSPLWGVNAKHPAQRYDASLRAKEKAQLINHFKPMIEEAKSWLADSDSLMPDSFPNKLMLTQG